MAKRDYAQFVKILMWLWIIGGVIGLIRFLMLLPLFSLSPFFICFNIIGTIINIVGIILILNKKFLGIVLLFLVALAEVVYSLIDSSMGDVMTPITRVAIISAVLFIRKNRKSGWKLLLLDLRRTLKNRKKSKNVSLESSVIIEPKNGSVEKETPNDEKVLQQEKNVSKEKITIEEAIKDNYLPPISSCVEKSISDDKKSEQTEPFAEKDVKEKSEQIASVSRKKLEKTKTHQETKEKTEKASQNSKERAQTILIFTAVVILILSFFFFVYFALNNDKKKTDTVVISEQVSKSKDKNAFDSFTHSAWIYYSETQPEKSGTYDSFRRLVNTDENKRWEWFNYLTGVKWLDDRWTYDLFTEYLRIDYENEDYYLNHKKDVVSNNKKRIYDYLSIQYEMGSFEKFCSEIDNKEKRRKVYDAISKLLDVGEFDDFSSKLGYDFIYEIWEAYRYIAGDEKANTLDNFAEHVYSDETKLRYLYDRFKKEGFLDDTWNYDDFKTTFLDCYYKRTGTFRKKTAGKNVEESDANITPSAESNQIVYIAVSKNAYAYHKKIDCKRLESSSTISKVPLSEAVLLNKKPCSLCYKQSFWEKNKWIIIISILLIISVLINIILWAKNKKKHN